MKDIVIYTGPGCAHCETAKAMLRAHRLEFVEKDVSDPDTLEDLARRLPRARSLPQIFADGEHLGNDEDLRLRLKEP